ncbi:MAG: MBL fold metallo-hydrolase [Patescibacteria group bacterium]|nr:MBL fold metallo-hydrolase [Patescibacteria group bacterium]
MEITWHGHSCFTIKEKGVTIVTDPYTNLGTKLPKLKGDIVTLSDELIDAEGDIAEVDGEPKVLSWPGEYEVKGVGIEGFSAFHFAKSAEKAEKANCKVVIYNFFVNGFKICHLSGLGHRLTSELTESIGDVDILLVPIGGNLVIDHKKAVEVIEAIEPRIVIPMYYHVPGSKLDISGAEEFLKAVGKEGAEEIEVFEVAKKEDLPDDKTDYVVLKPMLG